MFTGIIEEVGIVARYSDHVLGVRATTVMEGLALGDSISINGACMTVTEVDADSFEIQLSPESEDRTTLSALHEGDRVNLERSMAANGRFGGHFVLGHVDGVGHVEAIEEQGEFSLWRFEAPPEVARYLVPKGSVTIDGISLTVVAPAEGLFSVAVIPATIEKTTFQHRRPGDSVNMEADVLGKYILHYMEGGTEGGITKAFLSEHGFA